MSQPNSNTAPAVGTDHSVDKIRDILFGAQVRSIDERIQALEQSLKAQFNAQLHTQKLASDEAFSQLREHMQKQESQTRSAHLDAVANLTQSLAKQAEHTKQQFLQSEQHTQSGLAKLSQVVAQLEAASVPRQLLSQYLVDLSNQLKK